METKHSAQVLVVEDNADDSFILSRQLAKAQIDDYVTMVESGEQALEFLANAAQLPLAVFLDLHLPGLSGIELLEKLKQDSRFKDMPIIVMTGSVNPNHLSECSRLGVTAYLPKPVSLSVFIKTIAHIFPQGAGSQ